MGVKIREKIEELFSRDCLHKKRPLLRRKPKETQHDAVEECWNLRHIQRLNSQLSSVGCWPHKFFGKKRLHHILSAYNMFLIIMANIFSLLAVIYLWQRFTTIPFFDLGHIVVTILMNTLYMTRLVQSRLKKHQDVIWEYLFKFHLFYYKNKSEIYRKVYREIHIYSGILTLYVAFNLFGGVLLFLAKPWYNNYRIGMFSDHRPPNVTFEHSVYFYVKDDYFYKDLTGYWILFAINVPNTYNVCAGVTGVDLLLFLIVLQINGHLKIMKQNLMSFPEPEHGLMYSPEENVRIRALLREIVIHHSTIITFVNQCTDCFKEYLFIFLLFIQIVTCFLLLELSILTFDAVTMYGPLTAAMAQQLFVLSFMFEAVNTRSDELKHAVYAIPWESMDKGNRQIVLILLFKTQSTISIKAGGVVIVGVQTMASILKTSVSYFMMMQTMAAER